MIVKCQQCGIDVKKTPYKVKSVKNHFCSTSCSNKFRAKEKICAKCGIKLNNPTQQQRVCNECNPSKVDWSKTTLKSLRGRMKNIHGRIRELARKVYKDSNRQMKCEKCGYDKYVEICHIKAIKDFDEEAFITDINQLDNLKCLCPNCHKELDLGL